MVAGWASGGAAVGGDPHAGALAHHMAAVEGHRAVKQAAAGRVIAQELVLGKVLRVGG